MPNQPVKPLIFSERKAILTVFCCALLLLSSVLLMTGCDIDDLIQLESGDGTSGGELTLNVRVVLAESDGVKIEDSALLDVPFGGEARFPVSLEEGVVIESISSGGRIEDGVLIVPEVYAPTTVRIETRRLVLCDFLADTANAEEGSVSASLPNASYWSETEITLNATPAENFQFLGYTVGKTLAEGGEIVSSSQTYTFMLSESLRIFANFASTYVDPATTVTVPRNKWVLLYHPNGGIVKSTGKDEMHTEYFSSTYYHCPNTLPNEGQFTREGYVLLGYNTAPDGSGTYYAPGWNVIMPERGAISLYCVWVEETPASAFTYQKISSNKAVAITKYNGEGRDIVIPETIDGLPVTTITSQAFVRTEIDSLVISRNVTTIQDNAFVRCATLQSLYFSDSVLTVSDTSFANCTELKTIYMMATRLPYYPSSRNGTYAIKYERLITAPGRKLIITSGSNSAYGINSPLLMEELEKGGYDFSVVNYGTNASTAATFYIEVISHFINEGDILLHEPEFHDYQWGRSEINTTLWQIFEGAYDAFSLVDLREYTKFFSSFSSFNKARDKGKKFLSYETYTSDTVNEYGDYSKNKVGATSDFKSSIEKLISNGNKGTTKMSSAVTNISKHYTKLNRVLDMVAEKGGEVVISFAAILKIALDTDSQVTGGPVQAQYETSIDQLIHGTRISRVSTYLMDSKYVYNSNYHVNSEGAIVRTKNVAADLLAYLAKKK